MYTLEKDVPGGLRNYPEALWLTAMLLTSLGSEYWPCTGEGRALCFLLAASCWPSTALRSLATSRPRWPRSSWAAMPRTPRRKWPGPPPSRPCTKKCGNCAPGSGKSHSPRTQPPPSSPTSRWLEGGLRQPLPGAGGIGRVTPHPPLWIFRLPGRSSTRLAAT